jgi:hypothetical protein
VKPGNLINSSGGIMKKLIRVIGLVLLLNALAFVMYLLTKGNRVHGVELTLLSFLVGNIIIVLMAWKYYEDE